MKRQCAQYFKQKRSSVSKTPRERPKYSTDLNFSVVYLLLTVRYNRTATFDIIHKVCIEMLNGNEYYKKKFRVIPKLYPKPGRSLEICI